LWYGSGFSCLLQTGFVSEVGGWRCAKLLRSAVTVAESSSHCCRGAGNERCTTAEHWAAGL
jgi:hypothetical protein